VTTPTTPTTQSQPLIPIRATGGTTSDTLTTTALGTGPTPAAALPAGARAPAFALRCGQHCSATLEDYRGRPLVLAFYVADWHPVCTGQLERYRDLAPELDRLGADLVAVSPDTFWSHAAFARAHRLPFPLLSDDSPRGAIARAYGVYDPLKESVRRALFVVDAAGSITWSAEFPEALDPGIDGILTALETLGDTAQRHGDAAPHAAAGAGSASDDDSTRCRRCQGRT
jgi:peroxiredoxin